jgi:ribosomal protein L37AE/L43A
MKNVDAVLRAADRFLAVCRRPPHCPECKSEQVQIIAHHLQPAQWKCRICKHPFAHEPAHHPFCEFWLDQYPFECTCGLTARRATWFNEGTPLA